MLTPPKHMQQPIQSHELKVPIADSSNLVYACDWTVWKLLALRRHRAEQERRNIRKICTSFPLKISHNLFPFSSECANCISYNLFYANDLLEYHQHFVSFIPFPEGLILAIHLKALRTFKMFKIISQCSAVKSFIPRISSSKIKFPLRILCSMQSILESLSHCVP